MTQQVTYFQGGYYCLPSNVPVDGFGGESLRPFSCQLRVFSMTARHRLDVFFFKVGPLGIGDFYDGDFQIEIMSVKIAG